MKQMHLWISGRVQGVGFRHFTRQHAQSLGLAGWVKNLPDGRVEAILQGSEESIQKMLNHLQHGPTMANVKDIQTSTEEVDSSFNNFSVKY
ncbi:MAG: acylphosphatase [Bacteroidota bacterium]